MLAPKAETALTLAACEYALGGIGVAWLPMTLVALHLAGGRLHCVSGLPEQSLRIVMIRLAGASHARKDKTWQMLKTHPDFPDAL